MINNIQDFFDSGMKRYIPDVISDIDPAFNTVVNLGCGKDIRHHMTNLDFPEWNADIHRIPFEKESVSQIHAYHFFEHVSEPVKVLQECQRVLKPGGHINIIVPYYTSQMQAHDLDHKHAFCEETWRNLFSKIYYDKYKIEWKFDIGINIIIGVVERNLCLMTQLTKRK